MVDKGVAPLLAVILLFCQNAKAAVIPRDTINFDDSSGTTYIVNDGGSYEGYPDGYDEDELDMDIMLFTLMTIVLIYIFICVIYVVVKFVVRKVLTRNSRISLLNDDQESRRRHRTTEQLNARWPSPLDDEEEVKDKLAKLTPEEQFYYKQGEEFIKQNPPLIIPHALSSNHEVEDPIIDDSTRNFINEEGANAWEFQPDPNLPNDTVLVENKTEVTFLNFNYEASVMTNLPIPRINRVYYCEFKIFELNINAGAERNHQLGDNETISFGLSTSPYPYFRLPGKHHHSIAYDSSGARRFNDSFQLDPKLGTLFPRLEKGDVVGIGYRSNSGTVFFTRNGKKLKEDSVGGHIRGWKFKYLYPIVGSNIPCKIHVNFGTYGFVYIEANVKKWGFAKSNGMKLPPPSYEEYGQDTLLESGCEDEMSDNETASSINDGDILDSQGELLPPPPGFEYSTSPIHESPMGLINEEIDLDSLPVEPPSYSDDENYSKIRSDVPLVGSSSRHISEDPDVAPDADGYTNEEEDAGDDDDDSHGDGDGEERNEHGMVEDDSNDKDHNGSKGNTNGNTLANQFIQDY